MDNNGGGTVAREAPGPLISHTREGCTECWGCVRHCPARALRAIEGGSEVIEARCVKCGACVTECGNSSHVVRDDLPRVRELLLSGVPVVALLSSEHLAAMNSMSTDELIAALVATGFDSVETTVPAEELVAAAYEQVHVRTDSVLPRLRSTCPVAVDWVRRFHPELTGALVPVASPYVVQARLIRAARSSEVRIVYVSPCWARKDEIYDSRIADSVDVAIGFDELRSLLEDTPSPHFRAVPSRRPVIAKTLSAIDGFPRRTLKASDRTDPDVVTVRGLQDIDCLLSAIRRGETAPAVVDMLACEGCIDGPAVDHSRSVYAKRNIDAAERAREMSPEFDPRTLFATLPSVELTRSFDPRPAPSICPDDDEIDRVLEAGEFAGRSATIDCGACGYRTCVDHAAAISLGNSSWDLCFPLAKKRLVRERERYAEAAVTDELTGLLNRRAFDARLEEEAARAKRYREPLSLIMIDLDGFKEVNDRHGHSAGDALLRAVGVLLLSEIRATDHAVRYGGDEFAVILVNTVKTDAWAVAEKLRSQLKRLNVDVGAGYRIGSTASVGVSTFGEEFRGAKEMLEAADAALYRAKRAGRDRVEISAG